MLNNQKSFYNGKRLQGSYEKSSILSLDPVGLVLKVYDFVILNCKKKDADRASKGLIELISALDFKHEEVSLGLFRLYQYCLDKIKEGEFEEPVVILERLRGSWDETADKDIGGNGPVIKKQLSFRT